MNRIMVFIDGGNFYFKLRELRERLNNSLSLLKFQFRRFFEHLVSPDRVVEIRYYIGAIKRQKGNEKSERMYSAQQQLVGKLQQQGIDVTFGEIIRHPDGSFHEKGVDVRLAVEMIRYARLDRYDIAYLLSSDTDLVPAVEEVQSFGKKVHYVGIPKGQSFGLSKVSDDVRLIRPEEIESFFELEKKNTA